MSSTRRGGSLENALLEASRAYRKEGAKVVLVKQEPRQAAYGQQNGYAAGHAPVDFLGAMVTSASHAALAIEAKEARGKSLPVSRLRDDQITLMGLLHDCGADVRLVVYFADLDEPYSAPWPEVATFLALRWRESFSLAWFRVVGTLLPQEEDGSGWRVRFLNGRTHPQLSEAKVELERDQAKPRTRHDTEDDEALQIPPPANEEERRARTQAAFDEGVRRQQKKAPSLWGRR